MLSLASNTAGARASNPLLPGHPPFNLGPAFVRHPVGSRSCDGRGAKRFYQRKAEWVGLADRHPELFERARQIERKVLSDAGVDGDKSYDDFAMQGRTYTWSQGETLDDLLARRDEILQRHYEAMERAKSRQRDLPLVAALESALDEDDDTAACTVCAL